MKKATRKEIEAIAEMWYNRAGKLGHIANNKHIAPDKRMKANRLMIQMSVRLTRIGQLLTPKPIKNLEKGGLIIKP